MRKEGYISQIGRVTALGLLVLATTYVPIAPLAVASTETPPPHDICTILPNEELLCVPPDSITQTVDAPSEINAADAQILNGKPAGHVPSMGALLQKEVLDDTGSAYLAQFAGAVIVDQDAVLLETHVTYDEDNNPFQAEELCVGYGTDNLDDMSFENGNIVCGSTIERAIVDQDGHLGYSLLTLASTIGTDPIKQDQYPVQYAQLATSTDVLVDNTGLTTYGFGVIDESTMHASHTLLKAHIYKNPTAVCNQYYESPDGQYITAGDGHNKVDSSIGDSSGPLVYSSDSIRALTVGLNSFGPTHGSETYNSQIGIVEYACGSYLDIAAYASQIESLIGSEELAKVYAAPDTYYFGNNIQKGVAYPLPYSLLVNDRRAWEITGIGTVYKVDKDGALKPTSDVTIELYTNGTGRYVFSIDKTTSEYIALAVASNRKKTQTQTVSIRLAPYVHFLHLPIVKK